MITYLNGAYTDDTQARIAPADRGLTLADGVFDTMLVTDGNPVSATAHFNRLLRHADVLRLPHHLDAKHLQGILAGLIEKNDSLPGRWAVRTTITRGAAARGLIPDQNAAPTVLMTCAPAPDPAAAKPTHAIIAQSTRRNDLSPLSRVKSLQYADNLIALMEAQDRGATDALLLNTHGHVACAATANIFILEGSALITPPLEDGVLDGITRAGIMRDHNVTEDHITPARLLRADGIFLTNSLMGIRPVAVLEGKKMAALNFPGAAAA